MNKKNSFKNVASLFLRIGLSGALMVYLFSRMDTKEMWSTIKSADPFWMTVALAFFMGIHFVILYRWVIFLKALGVAVPFKVAMRYFLIGLFGNLFLPTAVGGDIIKAVGLCMYSPERTKVVASVLLDRLSGFAGIILMAIVFFCIGFGVINDYSLMLSIFILGGVSSGILFVLFNEKIYSFACRVFAFIPKLQKSLMDIHYDVALLRGRMDTLWKAIGLSCLSQFGLALIFFFISKGLNQDIRLLYFLIFVPLICVAASMPSIGGLGVREAGAAYLFAKVAVPAAVSVSISLISFSFMIFLGLLGGVIYVTTVSPGRLQHHQTDSGVSSKIA